MLFQAGAGGGGGSWWGERLMLKSPKSSMFSLFSVTLSIMFTNWSDHS